MCWGPDSPEVIAQAELRERAERKKLREGELKENHP
jgi:hypothetical protein